MKGLSGLGTDLHSLYVSKFNPHSELNPQQVRLLERFENAKLLRVFVDPSVNVEFPSGYVPTPLELELCYVAKTGTFPRNKPIKDLLDFVGIEISRVHNEAAM